jgi:hypothetical protein
MNMPAKKEPFISKHDRPEVKLPAPDQPISELRVRDLQAILSYPIFKVRKDFYKEFAKDIKEWAYEKPPYIEFFKQAVELGPDPTVGGDPARGGIEQVIQIVGGLAQRVEELSDQVARLQKR